MACAKSVVHIHPLSMYMSMAMSISMSRDCTSPVLAHAHSNAFGHAHAHVHAYAYAHVHGHALPCSCPCPCPCTCPPHAHSFSNSHSFSYSNSYLSSFSSSYSDYSSYSSSFAFTCILFSYMLFPSFRFHCLIVPYLLSLLVWYLLCSFIICFLFVYLVFYSILVSSLLRYPSSLLAPLPRRFRPQLHHFHGHDCPTTLLHLGSASLHGVSLFAQLRTFVFAGLATPIVCTNFKSITMTLVIPNHFYRHGGFVAKLPDIIRSFNMECDKAAWRFVYRMRTTLLVYRVHIHDEVTGDRSIGWQLAEDDYPP